MYCEKCLVYGLLILAFAVIAGEKKNNSTAWEFYFPPQLGCTFEFEKNIQQDGVSSSEKGRLGLILSGSPVHYEFSLGWVNAFLLEDYRNHSVTGLFCGIYGNPDSMTGLQVSAANQVRQLDGVQISLIGNLNQYSRGIQISGLLNSSAQEFSGLQIGMVNQIGNLSEKSEIKTAETGLHAQIGIVNQAKGNAIQFGLLNINPDSPIPYFPFVRIWF